jgi:hypothetical protein
MVTTECAGSALAVHTTFARFTMNVVILDLGDVVTDIVNQFEPSITSQMTSENRSQALGQSRAIREGVIPSRSHRI